MKNSANKAYEIMSARARELLTRIEEDLQQYNPVTQLSEDSTRFEFYRWTDGLPFPSNNSESITGYIRLVVNFKNDYGASVIWDRYSYGSRDLLWELALLHYGEICHDNVEGFLDSEDVMDILRKIANMKAGENDQCWRACSHCTTCGNRSEHGED